MATLVLEAGRRFTFRVALHAGGSTVSEVVRTYGALGCRVDVEQSLVGLSCEEGQAQAVADRLAADEEQDRLDYERGRQASYPHPRRARSSDERMGLRRYRIGRSMPTVRM